MSADASPKDMLQIENGQEISFVPVRFEVYSTNIRPTYAGAPREKAVKALRIHVRPEDKKYLPYYWDITPGHLVEGLIPLLPGAVERAETITIRAFLVRPKDPASKRYTITVRT